jgi:glucose/arabinose dehydrogenase
MRARIAIAALIGILAGLLPAPARALPPNTRVETYRSGVNFPIDMAWEGGTTRLFFTEKNSGRIRVMLGRTLLQTPCAVLPVNNTGERGAMGIGLAPNFGSSRHLYVYYTNRSPLENRITRFTVEGNRCTNPRHVVTGLPASSVQHHGGHLEIVGDKLFVSTGDQQRPELAQRLSSRVGKILRYNLDGTIPTNNPFGNAVWSSGQRNPYGLAHQPRTTRLWATDNGPECDDEVNRIVRGGNYGWGPRYRCGTAGVGPSPRGPEFRWSAPVAPTDATWYSGPLQGVTGGLIVADYLRGRLHRFAVGSSGALTRHQVTYDSNGARHIVDVSPGPGRWLYFATPTAIYRIVAT